MKAEDARLGSVRARHRRDARRQDRVDVEPAVSELTLTVSSELVEAVARRAAEIVLDELATHCAEDWITLE